MKKLTTNQIKQIEELMDMSYVHILGYFESTHKYHKEKLEISEFGIKYGHDEYNDYCENSCWGEAAITLPLETVKQLLIIIGEIE